MLRSVSLVLLLLACSCGTTIGPRAYRGRPTGPGGLETFLGIRSLPRDTWGDVRNQPLVGMSVMVPVENSPFSFELNGSASKDEDGSELASSTIRGRIWDLGAGLRMTLPSSDGSLLPYVAIGGSALYAQIDDRISGTSIDDTVLTPYLRIGLQVVIGNGEYAGLEWRTTGPAEVDLGSGQGDARYRQLTLVVGVSW